MENKPAKSQIYAHTLIGLLVVFLFFPCTIFSQQHATNKKAKRFFEQAELLLISGKLQEAEQSLLKTLQYDEQYAEAWLMLGEIKLELNRKDEAVNAFRKVHAINAEDFPMAYAVLAKIYYERGMYDSAVVFYEFGLKANGLKPEMQTLIASRMLSAKTALELVGNPFPIVLKKLDTVVNTKADEFVNSLRLDGKQLLFTRKTPKANGNASIFEEFFYISEADTLGEWRSAKLLRFDWGDLGNMGAVAFSADGKTLVFAGCGWSSGYGSCDLYISTFEKGKWTLPVNMGNKINSNAWESQPSFSVDGKSLYFVSNRSGGFGGSDIYQSILLDDGSWSKPINLGATINTSMNEMAPFIHADGQSLYFSSEGHPGLGEHDIFISRLDAADRWSSPVNLGVPINSGISEINLIISTDGKLGFISAKGKDGKDHYDIYSFDLPEIFKPLPMVYVSASVVDAVSGLAVDASFKLFELDGSGLITEGKIDHDDGLLLTTLKANREYALHIHKKGYLFQSVSFSPEQNVDNRPYELLVRLQPLLGGVEMVLRNVFFNWNEAELQPASFAELDELAEFLKSNPDLKIELGGHTDNTGDEAYNQSLSYKRAQSVKNYLIAKGINSERMIAKGYGSSKPETSNDTERGRSLNRRTSLKILP